MVVQVGVVERGHAKEGKGEGWRAMHVRWIGIFLVVKRSTNSGVQIEHMVLGHQMVTIKTFQENWINCFQDPRIKRSKKLCVQ